MSTGKSKDPPLEAERKKCWNARDDYWNCMNQAKDDSNCAKQRKIFEQSCAATWVKHFDRKFKFDAYKKELEKEGYQQKPDFDEAGNPVYKNPLPKFTRDSK